MDFKVGNNVKIKSSRRTFYADMYPLTIFTGVVQSQRDGFTYINFNNSFPTFAILSGDLNT